MSGGEFIEARLLDRVAYGFQIGPQVNVEVVPKRNGHERRSRNDSDFLWRGSAPMRGLNLQEYDEVFGAYLACWGPWRGFRFKNHVDFAVANQPLGLAPAASAAVQLVRTYQLFGGQAHTRNIKKPVAGTLVLRESGIAKPVNLDATTGLVTPVDSWTEGAPLTADFEYDIPMRFVDTWLPSDYRRVKGLDMNIGLIELRNP